MQKIIIIGCPGSGKSTFARGLHLSTGLPIHHMDLIFWRNDKSSITSEELKSALDQIMQNEHWIIDGNYISTLTNRLEHCDTVFFLDYPKSVCENGIRTRMGKPRPDMPWIEGPQDAEELLRYLDVYFQTDRSRIIAQLKAHTKIHVHVFHDRQEADDYLKNI